MSEGKDGAKREERGRIGFLLSVPVCLSECSLWGWKTPFIG